MSDRTRTIPLGRVVLGVVLLLAGVGWLLQALDVVDVPWQIALSLSLILVGAAIVAVGRHGGLIALGVVLTVVLTFASILDVPFRGGVGERSFSPTSATELQGEYHLAIGRMTVDLSGAPVHGREIRVTLGIGELIVIVAEDVAVRVVGHAGAGEVVLFGEGHGGVSVDEVAGEDSPAYELEASVGLGKVEVRR